VAVAYARCIQLYVPGICCCIFYRDSLYDGCSGVKTLRTQDTSGPRHFGTILLLPKCPDSSAPVPKCLADTSALVPTSGKHFFATIVHTEERFTVILLAIIIKEDH